MNVPFKLPPFVRFIDALKDAGIRTDTARRFWGGVDESGGIVVTSWTDAHDGTGRFYIWRPPTNHGGLKAHWEVGNIRPGTKVRMILLRQRGNEPIGGNSRTVAGAALMPGTWKVVELVEGESWQAVIEPTSKAR